MERKRPLASEDAKEGLPSAKSSRDKADVKLENEDVEGAGDVAEPTPPSATFRAPFAGVAGAEESDEWGKVLLMQRNQLSSLAKEQKGQISKLSERLQSTEQKVENLQADAGTAISYITSVQEDLTLTLARLGAGGDDIEAGETSSVVAEAVLQGDWLSGMHLEHLGAKCDATKRLLAQVIEVIEDGLSAGADKRDEKVSKANDDLHSRLRRSNDQLSQLQNSETALKSKIAALEEKLTDSEMELERRRNQVTSLRSLRSVSKADKEPEKPEKSNSSQQATSAAVGQNTSNAVVQELRSRVASLTEELEGELKRRTELAEKLEAANHRADVPNLQQILGSALYQTMEANLQELVLKEQQWKVEREVLVNKAESVTTMYEGSLISERESNRRRIELMEKQLREATKVAEQAKSAKDRMTLIFEARKLDASVQEDKVVLEKQLSELQNKNDKLEEARAALKKELEQAKGKLSDAESRLSSGTKYDKDEAIARLREDLENEKNNSDGLYEEMESLSSALNALESEKAELEKQQRATRDQLLNAQKERAGLRQERISLREEARTMSLKLKAEEEQNKSLQALLTSSRKVTAETQKVLDKCKEEVGLLEAKLAKVKQVSEETTRSMRQSQVETEELKNAKSAAQARAVSLTADVEQEKYKVKRLEEQVATLNRRLKKEEEKNTSKSGSDVSKEELLREYRKIRNCSVKTDQPKEVVLLRCGHLFSRQCVDDLVAARNRKCPICGKGFSTEDVRPIYFS